MRRAQALRQLRKPASLTTSCSQKRFCAESKRCPSFYKLLCVIEAPFNNLQLSNIFYVRLQLRPSWCITILPRAASSSLSRTFPISKHPVHCACTAFDLQPTVVREAAPVSYLVRGVGPSQLRSPYVTGSSVLGITYAGGVMLASDTLASYGSTKRYKSVQRLVKVNDSTVLGAGGEISDLQFILNMLDDLRTEDYCADDGQSLSSQELYSYLSRVMYNRRNKMDPLWNSLIIAGLEGGKPFLGSVNMIGVAFSDDHLATGFGNHLARPLFRKRHRPDMSEEEATALIREALEVCYYRDKQSINKFQIAKVTASEGVSISEPFALPTKWEYKAFVDPTKNAVGVW